MMTGFKKEESLKQVNHVVPASWQRRFAAPGQPGPYYKNLRTGETLNAQGPGEKMSEVWANVVFDRRFVAGNSLEDWLCKIESDAMQSLDKTIQSGMMDAASHVHIAHLLLTQAARYPEHYPERMDGGRYQAIHLKDAAATSSVQDFNAYLQATGWFPGFEATEGEFEIIKATAAAGSLDQQVDEVLQMQGYEAEFNPMLIMAGAAIAIPALLLHFDWDLIVAPRPVFLLSDHPVPARLKPREGYSLGLSATLGLRINPRQGNKHDDGRPIVARPGLQSEIDDINREVRNRAAEWICGPDTSVHAR